MTWTTSPFSSYDAIRYSLSALKLGGSFTSNNPRISVFGYSYARKLGIRISIHRNKDATYTVTRVA